MSFQQHENIESKEINKLIQFEKRNLTRGSHSVFQKGITLNGQIPILILVVDAIHPVRAKRWAEALSKITNAHTRSSSTRELTPEILLYMDKSEIYFLIILDIGGQANEVLISCENNALRSFLTNIIDINNNAFQLEMTNTALLHSRFDILGLSFIVGRNVDIDHFFSLFFGIFKLFRQFSLEDNSSLLIYSGRGVANNLPLNRVEVNTAFLKQNQLQENDFVMIFNPLNFTSKIGCLKVSSKINQNEINLSPSFKKKLDLAPWDRVILHPLKKVITQNIQIQNVNKLPNGNVTVSDDIYRIIRRMGTDHFEVFNRVTASSFDIKLDKIDINSALKPGTLQLSYLQREFLNYEHPPDSLSEYYYNQFHAVAKEAQANITDEQLALFEGQYVEEQVLNVQKYEQKVLIKNFFKSSGYNRAVIYPIHQEKSLKKKKVNIFVKIFIFLFSLLRKIGFQALKWGIRPVELSLNVTRPYSTDESSNIVRMSKSAMNLLGIEENDLVIIGYRDNSIQVPVLEIDSYELFKETNIITYESSINISVGIPAYLRNKLKIKQIGKICKVERNLWFLFKKNWNMQFLPVIATIFTIFSLSDLRFVYKIMLSIALVPVAIYATLSGVREKIPPKIRRNK